MVTVTGTENLLMAAALADGETVLENAAQEPEVVDLAAMLIGDGREDRGRRHRAASASRASSGCTARSHRDRAPTASRPAPSCARSPPPAARCCCSGARADHLDAVIEKLREAGARIESRRRLDPRRRRRPAAARSSFRTSEYPAFPTDMQAQFMALDCIADGTAVVTETIFENRFMHVARAAAAGRATSTSRATPRWCRASSGCRARR